MKCIRLYVLFKDTDVIKCRKFKSIIKVIRRIYIDSYLQITVVMEIVYIYISSKIFFEIMII